MANNKYSLLDEMQFDPYALEGLQDPLERIRPLEPVDLQYAPPAEPSLMPDAQMPDYSQGLPEDPNSEEALRAQIRADLLKRVQSYDPEGNAMAREAAVEAAGPGVGKNIARGIAGALGGMIGKMPQTGQWAQEDAQARKEAAMPFDKLEEQQKRDMEMLNKFRTMDAVEQMNELKSAQMVAQTDARDLEMQLKQKMYSDKMAASDPKSAQSQFARKFVTDMTGKPIGENVPATAILPVLPSLVQESKRKAAVTLQELKGKQKLEQEEVKAKAKAEEKAKAPTEGEKTMDREFAKKYSDYLKDKGSVEENRKIFNGVINDIETGKVQTGFVGGWQSKLGEKVGYQTDVKEAQDKVRAAVQAMLRPILGGQFAEKEGERVIKASFDPARSKEANVAALKRELGKIEGQVKIFESQAKYFKENKGTLKGWTAPEIKPLGDENPNWPAIGTIKNGYKYIGGNPNDQTSWEKQ